MFYGALIGALADQCQSVAKGDYYGFESAVGGHDIIESFHSEGLRVMSQGIGHVAVPKRVVGQNVSPGLKQRYAELEILRIQALVGVNEYQAVGSALKVGHHLDGIADNEIHPLATWQTSERIAQKILILVEYLDRVDRSSLLAVLLQCCKPLGHAEGGVAGKSA